MTSSIPLCVSLMCEWDEHQGPCSDGVDRTHQLINLTIE